MKTEVEICKKIFYYQELLNGMEIGKLLDDPAAFAKISQYVPKEVLELLKNPPEVESVIRRLPTEDHGWIKDWFFGHISYPKELLENRITILKWVLGNEKGEEENNG